MSGTWASQNSSSEITNVSFEGGALKFDVSIETPQGAFDLSFVGSIDGDALNGNVSTDFGDLAVEGGRAQ